MYISRMYSVRLLICSYLIQSVCYQQSPSWLRLFGWQHLPSHPSCDSYRLSTTGKNTQIVYVKLITYFSIQI